MSENDQQTTLENISAAVLIAEDDHDQRSLLVDFAKSQIKKVLEDDSLSDPQRQKLKSIQIKSVTNIASLQRAVSTHKNVLLAILDCNLPDTKGTPSHDQFIKTKHRITGQHRAVDIVIEIFPATPITLISSLNRFQRIIHLFYGKKHGIDINFINKNDPSAITKNIRHYLRQYLR